MDPDDIYDDLYADIGSAPDIGSVPAHSPTSNSTPQDSTAPQSAASDSTPLNSHSKPKRAISKKPLATVALLVVVVLFLLFRIMLHFQHDPTTSDTTFEKDVLKKEQPVYVLFCLPNPDRNSMQMRATVKKFQATAHVKPDVFICNINENFATASKYKAIRAPTLSVFDHGKLLGNIVGNKSMDELLAAINKLPAANPTAPK